ncbi:MAG: glycerate kinase [Coleofasciculus sp. B1-GNL1-01]|uniref:glycerate kinase n=1 Tax=Coleofasciculus sp. B1-GNL1-01 TaxID=3068484 RepID=UPI003302E27F
MTHPLSPFPSLGDILNQWIAGKSPNSSAWQKLVAAELTPPERAKAFGITADNVAEKLQARSRLFESVYTDVLALPSFAQKIEKNPEHSESIKTNIILSLWRLWIPLAIQLADYRQQLYRPLIQGILGGQGTGKTTLAVVLKLILAQLGYRTLSLSIDDLYKTYQERQRLREQDPRLIWRGPPGTHDVELGVQVLDELRSQNSSDSILVPRFDKSAWQGAGDRTDFEPVQKADIVLFEGWFVGVRPVAVTVFSGATPAPIETESDRAFARDMNEQLKQYLPLWERLDRLIVLYPTDYRLSLQWRRQAEAEMIATGKSGMSDSEINEFVKYFWKALHPELFITPLIHNPNWVDLVIEINSDHTPDRVYYPGE